MKARIRTALIVTALLLGTAPLQALRAPEKTAQTGVGTSVSGSGNWLSSGLNGLWSWMESLFDEEHGGILP